MSPSLPSILSKPSLPIGIELILLVLRSVPLALESADALQTPRALLLVRTTLAQDLHNPRLLRLLLEPALQAVVTLFAFLDRINSHTADRA